MRVAIIGGGWVGCHLASKLRNKYDVTIFEKNSSLFGETSYRNQNRLHLGFHYARNYKTRELCRNTYHKFMHDYGQFTEEVPRNYYCISEKSNIDFVTILKIFEDHEFQIANRPFSGLEGCINTEERYIDFDALFNHWNSTLSSITKFNASVQSYDQLSEYDYIINATNNTFDPLPNSFYELTITLLYRNLSPLPFDAVTLIDGNLFSIYPYSKNLYTLTDVEYTPIAKFDNYDRVCNYILDDVTLDSKITNIENRVLSYWKEFYNYMSFESYFLSTKSKVNSESGDRSPVVAVDGKIIRCFTGKIQGIYNIQEQVEKILWMEKSSSRSI